MKVILKDIGKIKNAEIDLSKKLTLFFGPNNNGKTYVSYCLYGLNRSVPFGASLAEVRERIQINLEDFFIKGSIELDLKEIFLKHRDYLREKYVESFKNFLPQLFGDPSQGFPNAEVSLSIFSSDKALEIHLNECQFRLGGHGLSNGKMVRFEKEEDGKIFLELTDNFVKVQGSPVDIAPEEVEKVIKDSLLEYTFSTNMESSYFLPAERLGIAVFGRELVLNRFSKSNDLFAQNEFIPYSLVINDAIQRQFQMSNLKNRNAFKSFVMLADEIEDSILKGKLTINETGDAFYSDNESQLISIRNTASTIKSLSSFVFYLRYFAHPGQVLFIDEPEINLHPNNQRLIARFIARLANMGISVFVSTHSDYVLREINTLIMLGKQENFADALFNQYAYRKDEVLKANNVGVYLFDNSRATEIDVSIVGFDSPTIDEAISDQNKAYNDIRWTLFED